MRTVTYALALLLILTIATTALELLPTQDKGSPSPLLVGK